MQDTTGAPLFPTAERVRELLDYSPDTGVFVWRVSTSNRAPVGAMSARSGPRGYLQIYIDSGRILAHRVAWLHFYGVWPTGDIDHINGQRGDNRISNLRDVPRSVNMQNQRRAKSNNKSSGVLGAYANGARWQAKIKVDGKVIRLGTHDTPEAAHAAYLDAKRKLHAGNML